jgi:SulP family sulfate permease
VHVRRPRARCLVDPLSAPTGRSARPTGIRRYVPILAWLPTYDRSWLTFDVIAGLTVWGLLVPESMAYASLAGLPPEAGLYTLVVSLLVYALFGTSRHLSVGPTSATAVLLATSVAASLALAEVDVADVDTYVQYAAAFVLVVGLVFLVAGLAKLGFITQFLSKPVMDGFVAGLAIFVAVGQLYKLFGVEKPSGNVPEKLIEIVRELPTANWTTFAIGAAALALLFLLPRVSKKLPAGLVVLFAGIAVSSALDLNGTYGVEVVGQLPSGLPSLAVPVVPLGDFLAMLLPAIAVVLVAFSEALGVAQEFAEKHGYEVNADQELIAHGTTNIAGAFAGGMIAAGGMSGSAVKEGAGGRSQVSSLVAWAVTIITVLFLTPLFTSLPEAVLAALIIHAVWHLMSLRTLTTLGAQAPREVWFGIAALLGVLLIDVLEGMVIGLGASLLFVVFRSSQPRVSSLGREPSEPARYSDLEWHSDNTPVPGVLIVRPDDPLYYANWQTVRNRVKAMIDEAPSPYRAVLFDLSNQYDLDYTSTEGVGSLVRELAANGIEVSFVGVHPAVIAQDKTGLLAPIFEGHMFPTMEDAVQHVEAAM